MGGKKSRNKGARFEREIAKQLSAWSGLDLRRTPLSGGWAKDNPHATGDITTFENFPFSIECKHHEGWVLGSLITGNDKTLEAWWNQSLESCVGMNKIPVVIFKRNYQPTWLLIPEKSGQLIETNFSPKIELTLNDQRMVIVLLDQFLERVDFNQYVTHISTR